MYLLMVMPSMSLLSTTSLPIVMLLAHRVMSIPGTPRSSESVRKHLMMAYRSRSAFSASRGLKAFPDSSLQSLTGPQMTSPHSMASSLVS